MRFYRRYTVLILIICTLILKLIVQPAHMPQHEIATAQPSPYLSTESGEAIRPDLQTVEFQTEGNRLELHAKWSGSMRYDLNCNLADNMQMECEGIAYMGLSADIIEGNQDSYVFHWAESPMR